MASMYSTPTERAKDEFWLNFDKWPMDTSERVQRHLSDCIMALVEAIESHAPESEILESVRVWGSAQE